MVGEICSRPAGGGEAEVEYHDNPEASAAKTRGGWLRSGDMGHTDADGWLFFDYRKGGGHPPQRRLREPRASWRRCSPSTRRSPTCFVYGVPAASGAPGEKDVVAAIVVVDRGELRRRRSVFARCREGLESNFVPSYLQVVDEIPKTASEKPQERFLLEGFAPDAPNVFVES